MGFIDGEEGDFGAAEAIDEGVAGEAFWGDVEDFELAVEEVGVELLGLFGGERGIESGGGDAFGAEGIDLIFHEGDQRGDDEGGAIEEEGWELVAEGFAGAGGEESESGLVIEEGGDDFELTVAELGVAEVSLEGVEKIHSGWVGVESVGDKERSLGRGYKSWAGGLNEMWGGWSERPMANLTKIFSSLVVGVLMGASGYAGIEDGGDFFSESAKVEARRKIVAMERVSKKDLSIETFKEIPAEVKGGTDVGDKVALNRLYEGWAIKRAKAIGTNGVYVMLVKNPAHLQVMVGNDTAKQAFTLGDRDELVSKMLVELRDKRNDAALSVGVNYVSSTILGHMGGGQKSARVESRKAIALPEKSSAMGWILPVILVGVVVWVVISIIKAIFRSRGSGGWGAGAGMGGGGGGGFMSSLFGSMLGVGAGMWMYNQFFGDHGTSAMGGTGENPGNSDPGFSGEDTNYSGSGGDFGNDAGDSGSSGWGDGGGDAGGGGEFGGGGDF